MMAKDFEIIDHTADVGIVAYGADLSQAFASAARAMFSLMVESGAVEEVEHRDIVVAATDLEDLLVAWLNELLYLFDAENMLFTRFDIGRLSDTHLEAKVYGEPVDSSRHQLKMGVKAATYHMVEVDQSNGSRVRVLFDV